MFKKIRNSYKKVTKAAAAACLAAAMLASSVLVPGGMAFGESTEKADFSSKRLVVLTDDPSLVRKEDKVIGQHGDVYLLQFSSAGKAEDAYGYYKVKAAAVEPDTAVEAAQGSAAGEADFTVDGEENPVLSLSDADPLPKVRKKDGVVALIDTGVSEGRENVVGRVSMIDDSLEGGTHGNDMLAAILSQDEDAQVLSIRALDDKGFGTVSSLTAAMEYAMEQKASIINLSLYARTTLSTSVLKEEIQKAAAAGITVIGAAGNDGQDASGYVPGSVEEACIIGAADKSGARLETSNYGKTVDYNIVAGSTSEAAALFTGFVSANGLDAVEGALGRGLIYSTGPVSADQDIIEGDEDFSGYELDRSKSVVVKYFFVDADRYREGDTIDDVFDRIYDEGDSGCYVGSADYAYTDVYRTKDGAYKFKAQTPMLAGYLAADEYKDAVFTYGTYGGEVVTDGVHFDRKTGIATMKESALRHRESDFADMQLQVMVPVSNTGVSVETKTEVEIVDTDGTSSRLISTGSGLGEKSIPLSITGLDGKLSDDDFTVYINDRKDPVKDFHWNEEEHSLDMGISACLLHRVRVEVSREADAVFHIAKGMGEAGEGTKPSFYLDLDGAALKTLKNNEDKAYKRNVPVSIYGVPESRLCDNENIITVTGGVGDYDDTYKDSSGTWKSSEVGRHEGTVSKKYLGVASAPRSDGLFGLTGNSFTWKDKNLKDLEHWTGRGKASGGRQQQEYKTWNVGVRCMCIHAAAKKKTDLVSDWGYLNMQFMVTNDWTETKSGQTYTYFTMTMLGKQRVNGSDMGQTMGGSVVFAVKDTEPEPEGIPVKAQKFWQDAGNRQINREDGSVAAKPKRPGSVIVHLEKAEAEAGSSDYSDWRRPTKKEWSDPQELSEKNGWSYEWTGLPNKRTRTVDGVETTVKIIWRVVEELPGGYKLVATNKSGSRTMGYTFRLHNRRDPEYTSKSVEKQWDDGSWEKRPHDAYVQLQRSLMLYDEEGRSDGEWTEWEVYSNVTLNDGNGWKHTWTQLPLVVFHSEGATQCRYRVVECTDATFKTPGPPENYECSVNGDIMTNKLNGGWVQIYKKSADPALTDNNKCYNLKGAQFTFYKDEGCTQAVGTLTTDENGLTDTLFTGPGRFWYRETKGTDDGHYLTDEKKYSVTVEADATKDNPLIVEVKEKPGNDPMGIELEKINDGGDPAKAPSLEGAQFTVKYYDNMDKDISGTPTRTWVLEVKKSKDGVYKTYLEDAYKVSGDKLYKDETEKPVLPYGTYSIEESKAAPDYKLEGFLKDKEGNIVSSFTEDKPAPYVTVVDTDGNGEINLKGGNAFTVTNKPVPMSLKVKKLDGKKEPLKGVTFKMKSKSGLAEKQDGWKETMTTGADGTVKWENLPADTYTITEIKTVKGMNLLKDPIEVELPMRMTEEEAKKNHLVDPDKNDKMDGVVWDEKEGVFYINDLTYTATNNPTFNMPMTGAQIGFAAFLPLLAGFAIIQITKKRRRT